MKIKLKLVFLTILMLGLVKCDENKPEIKHLRLTGILTGYGNGMIQISYNDPNEIMKDSIVVKDDKFEYLDTLNSPRFAFLKIMGNKNLKRDYYRIDFFLENSEVTLNLDVKKPKDYTITGSKTELEHREVIKATSDENQAYIAARNALKKKDGDSLAKETGYEQKVAAYLKALKNNKTFVNSNSGPYTLWLLYRYIPFKEVVEFLPNFNSSLKNNVYLKYLIKKRDAEERIEPGKAAPDFLLKDVSGKEYSLKDFRGNYLLLDFEASWCGPCKLEIPFLKASHKKYADKGLTIISVNLDKTRALWEKDKNSQNLPWKMLSDLNAFNGELTKNFSVTSIPRIFLIDPDGKIISSKLRQEKIVEKLAEIYGD